MDCNISIVFTGQIRQKLEVIIEAQHRYWQQLLREATKMEMAEEGKAKKMNEKDQEDKAAYGEGQKGGETRETRILIMVIGSLWRDLHLLPSIWQTARRTGSTTLAKILQTARRCL